MLLKLKLGMATIRRASPYVAIGSHFGNVNDPPDQDSRTSFPDRRRQICPAQGHDIARSSSANQELAWDLPGASASWGSRRLGGDTVENRGHCLQRISRTSVEIMTRGQPVWIVVGEPRDARSISPDECFQRKVDSDRPHDLHQRRAAFCATEDEEICRLKWQPDRDRAFRVVDMRKHRQAFFFTSATSLSTVSAWPKLLLIVIRPSAAMLDTPDNDVTTGRTKANP